MGRQRSPDLCGPSPKKDHVAGVLDPRKRKMDDMENEELHQRAALFAAKIQHKVQPSARSDQIWATSQQKTNTQGQDIDKMEFDDSYKDGEQNSNL